MKSLFANEEIILPSWLKILMETIDSETIQKLSENQEYRKMHKGKAVGVDGITKEQYGENLEENIESLLVRTSGVGVR